MLGRRKTTGLEAAVGAAAGLFASWVMSLAHEPISKIGSEEARRREGEASAGMPPATVRVAQAAAKAVGRPLADNAEAQAIGGKIVHYAYGTVWGAVFALLARKFAPRAPLLGGILFGAALWLVSDEILVPLFRFSRPPAKYPASTHAKALASHLVYGVATDAAWRIARVPLH